MGKWRKHGWAILILAIGLAVALVFLNVPLNIGGCPHCAKLIAGPCLSEYEPITLDVKAFDGQTQMCLLSLPSKPNAWKWSLDGSTLGYEIQSKDDKSSQLYTVKTNGTRHRISFLRWDVSDWSLSPDGQYLRHSTVHAHYYSYEVIHIPSGQGKCSRTFDEGSPFSGPCPPLQLTDGQWWSGDYPGIILKSNDQRLWDLLNYSTSLSPDGSRIVGVLPTKGAFVASTEAKMINWFGLTTTFPSGGPVPCPSFPSQTAWREDSKQFAIFPPNDKVLRVYNIGENGDVSFVETLALSKCPYDLLWSIQDNKFVIK